MLLFLYLFTAHYSDQVLWSEEWVGSKEQVLHHSAPSAWEPSGGTVWQAPWPPLRLGTPVWAVGWEQWEDAPSLSSQSMRGAGAAVLYALPRPKWPWFWEGAGSISPQLNSCSPGKEKQWASLQGKNLLGAISIGLNVGYFSLGTAIFVWEETVWTHMAVISIWRVVILPPPSNAYAWTMLRVWQMLPQWKGSRKNRKRNP